MINRLRRFLSGKNAPAPRSGEMIDRLKAQCEQSIGAFLEITPIDWAPRTILPSEGFAVCALCDLYGVATLIESGVYDGRSTTIWGAWRGGALSVVGIDTEPREQATQRLAKYSNVTLLHAMDEV